MYSFKGLDETAIAARFNRKAINEGWQAQLTQIAPITVVYNFDPHRWGIAKGKPVKHREDFYPAPHGAAHITERWRRTALTSPLKFGQVVMRLHYIPEKGAEPDGYRRVGPDRIDADSPWCITKPDDGKGWAQPFRPGGGLVLEIGDEATITPRRGTWWFNTFLTARRELAVRSNPVLFLPEDAKPPAERTTAVARLPGIAAVWKAMLDRENIVEIALRRVQRTHKKGFWNLRDYTIPRKVKLKNSTAIITVLGQLADGPARAIPAALWVPQEHVAYPWWPATYQLKAEAYLCHAPKCGAYVKLIPAQWGVAWDTVWNAVRFEPRPSGKNVIHPEGEKIRHARLQADQEAYNDKWESCWNVAGQTRHSLNVPKLENYTQWKTIAEEEGEHERKICGKLVGRDSGRVRDHSGLAA